MWPQYAPPKSASPALESCILGKFIAPNNGEEIHITNGKVCWTHYVWTIKSFVRSDLPVRRKICSGLTGLLSFPLGIERYFHSKEVHFVCCVCLYVEGNLWDYGIDFKNPFTCRTLHYHWLTCASFYPEKAPSSCGMQTKLRATASDLFLEQSLALLDMAGVWIIRRTLIKYFIGRYIRISLHCSSELKM